VRADADLVPLFRREFELCRVGPDDVVAVLSDGRTRPDYIAASSAAAASLGAPVFEVSVPTLGWDLPGPVRGMAAGTPTLAHDSAVLEAIYAGLSKASFVVDLVSETIIHVPLRDRLRNAGVRVLTINEPPDVLERMFPTEPIRAAVEAVSRRIEGTRELRLTSAAGTDLLYELDSRTPFTQYGYADVPGKWDHWPSALATVYPIDDATSGTVVFQPGDIVLPLKRYVEHPVHLAIDDGYVREISGGLDAELIRGFLDSWGEPAAYAVSHIGLGLHPRAQWSALSVHDKWESIGMDGRCFEGGFIFSTGPNRHTGRLVEAHLDFPMRGCTVTLDGETLIEAGQLVVAEPAEVVDAG
jgi:2,5-dihydroxypyridine 5,6-dioxygenase